jgi:hypothetical protein
LDERLKPLLTVDLPNADLKSVDCSRPLSRIALRQVLLEGLNDIVHFDKKFVGFDDTPEGRVIARFEDEPPPPLTCSSAPTERTLTSARGYFHMRGGWKPVL